MELTLSVLRCPDGSAPEVRQAAGGDLAIGRAADCDWVLADPERVLSKRHCVLEFRAGGWQVRDLSTNGTFLNRNAEPIGPNRAMQLSDGDRLRLGAWEIEVRLGQPAAAGWRPEAAYREPGYREPGYREPGLRFAAPDPLDNPMAPPLPPRPAFGNLLPDDFDPFAEEPPMPDHRPSVADAFVPPAVQRASLPDDWDLDAPLAKPESAKPHSAKPEFTKPERTKPEPARSEPDTTGPVVAIPPPAPPAADGGSLTAFLVGAGLPANAVAGMAPDDVLHQAGALLRASVAGLRSLLIARGDVKREFRIEQTMLRSAGNSPLKFAPTDEAAIRALLAGAGDAEVRETVHDLTMHQVATLAATQAAARALLDRLAPAAIGADVGTGRMLPGQREKRLWEAYRAAHQKLSDQFDDDFDSAFGKEFARAYERAIERHETDGRKRHR